MDTTTVHLVPDEVVIAADREYSRAVMAAMVARDKACAAAAREFYRATREASNAYHEAVGR